MALLAYLAAARPLGLHRRDAILGVFWPELDQARARHALSQSLHTIRRALGEGVIVTRGLDEVGIDRSRLWCDCPAFEEALDRGELEAALELYRGDLLDGVFLTDAPGFEQWLENERARLRQRAALAARTLADRYGREGRVTGANRWASRAAELDPLDERSLRRLMRARDRAGDRAGALLAYEGFAERLREELDVDPSPETRALADDIRARDELGSTSTMETDPPVKRAPPVERLPEAAGEIAAFRPSSIAAASSATVASSPPPTVGWTASTGGVRSPLAAATRNEAAGAAVAGVRHRPLWLVVVLVLAVAALVLLLSGARPLGAQAPGPSSGQRYERLLIRNAMVIDGTGNPARGPMDIVIEGDRIAAVRPAEPVDEFGTGRASGGNQAARWDRVIDATGKYVMPGIIDLHGHIQFSRNGEPMPKDYVYKLWLAHGITTIREPGSGEGIDTVVAHARLAAANRIAAPTIIPYATAGADTPDEARALVRRLAQAGARGLKVFINRPDVWAAIAAEAKALGLPIATDMKIQEHDAIDAARLGVRSIEHWYGIPDAAIPGPQSFPADYSYDDELDRFRWAGDLWRQADSARLSAVLDTMLAHDVTWDPTFAVYEANRDLSRARTLPWFAEYALPNVLAFFEPDLHRHGSYHLDWTTTDEVRWRDNMQIWMRWVREYAARGGNVTVGSDAGFIYHLYGFATIREMELHQEAGFHPLEVIRHATANGARALGLERTGVIRPGWEADLAIVDGNPLHNLKVLYGTGVQVVEDGEMRRRGGVQYTIRDGVVFDAPALLAEVREMVRAARTRASAP